MDPARSSVITHMIFITLLVLLNAMVSAAEIAFVSLNQTSVQELASLGDKRASRVIRLLNNPERLLATLQITITLSGFLGAALTATQLLSTVQGYIPKFVGSGEVIMLGLITIVSFLFIVLGELYPKRIASQMPDEVALKSSGFVTLLVIVLKPFFLLTSICSRLLQRLTPIRFNQTQEKFTRDEMQAIIEESRDEGSIDTEEFSMLEGVLSLDEKIAKSIMVPRLDVQMINIEDDTEFNIDEILASPYSRIPVYQSDRDNIIGIIHAKTLLKEMRHQNIEAINLRTLMHNPMFVPATMYIDDLLLDFKRYQQHMGILIDEHGGVEGIVTLEDLLEEIVGEIDDENDIHRSEEIQQVDEQHYMVSAGIDIDDFNQFFNLCIDEQDVDTLAGAIIRDIGYVPSEHEHPMIRIQDYVINPERVENGRIITVRVTSDPEDTMNASYAFKEDQSMIVDL